MTERIKKLREGSLNAVNRISAERAELVTDFYQELNDTAMPNSLIRANCFKYIFNRKQLYYEPGELIVGERGPEPKATPTYPEICLHSLQDLEILNNRPKVNFEVDGSVREIYDEKVIPYWKGRTNRERIFEAMSDEWLASYKAGVFTEFQEQRAPGHTVLGDRIYQLGMRDIIEEIELRSAELSSDESGLDNPHVQELQAMKITAEALIDYAERYADLLEQKAEVETNSEEQKELKKLAEICRKVPAGKPETMQEALQYYWFVHLGVITELNPWDSFNPGRLDQHLLPFYMKDLAEKRITKDEAKEILQSFWIKFNNHPSPPKMGVTAKESNTYTDFALINLGGVKEDGSDGVNELTYLLLDVIEEMRILQPSSMVQVSRTNPDEFLARALKIVKTGFGQPSIFNTDAIIEELLRQGKDLKDARNGGASGCVETGAFGTESYILTGYFNLTKILEVTLHNGVDPQSGKKIGLESGDSSKFTEFSQLMEAFSRQLAHFAEIKLTGNRIIEKIFAEHLPVPFLSLLIDDCINNGKDYNAGGARYNTSYVQGVGLGSVTDSLTALKYHVFDEKKLKMSEFLQALKADFSGWEDLRFQLIFKTPKYGNDDEYADVQAKQVFDIFREAIDGKSTARGGVFRINMLPTTSHVYFGSVIGATPDGRKARMPLSEGISPVQGSDVKGPTAVLKSATKIDHLQTGGTLLNQKFSPDFFTGESNLNKLVKLIRGYFRMMGHHIQFNVVSADTLRKAQKNPEKYRDLIVRVAGYSDYFNDLGEELQNEIIQRTEQNCV